MKPTQNFNAQQFHYPLQKAEGTEKVNTLQQVVSQEKHDASFFAFVLPKEVNDPEKWDEAWFANYE